jgi:hypothetical protein
MPNLLRVATEPPVVVQYGYLRAASAQINYTQKEE